MAGRGAVRRRDGAETTTARLQAATSSPKPVLLRVETDAGHGFGSTRRQRDAELADTYAFILSQTGDPRFRRRPGRARG